VGATVGAAVGAVVGGGCGLAATLVGALCVVSAGVEEVQALNSKQTHTKTVNAKCFFIFPPTQSNEMDFECKLVCEFAQIDLVRSRPWLEVRTFVYYKIDRRDVK
jgi:uncharacterized protein YcfJ